MTTRVLPRWLGAIGALSIALVSFSSPAAAESDVTTTSTTAQPTTATTTTAAPTTAPPTTAPPTTIAPTTTANGCHPAYSPCLPIVDDLNCSDLSSSQKPVTVHVIGIDPYFLDNDWTTATSRDGVGCEVDAPAQTTAPPSTTASEATSTTTAAAAATTTVKTQVQGAQQLPVTGAGGVAVIAVLGLALLNCGYLTASTTRRSRCRRSTR